MYSKCGLLFPKQSYSILFFQVMSWMAKRELLIGEQTNKRLKDWELYRDKFFVDIWSGAMQGEEHLSPKM